MHGVHGCLIYTTNSRETPATSDGKCVKSIWSAFSGPHASYGFSPLHTHSPFVVGIGPSKLVLLGGWSSYESLKSFNDLKVLREGDILKDSRGITSFCTEAPGHKLKGQKKVAPEVLVHLGLAHRHIILAYQQRQHNQPTNNHLNSNQPRFPPIHCTWVSTNVNGAPAFLGRRNAPSTVLPSSKAKGMATWKQPSGGRGGKNQDNKQERQETTATATATTATATTTTTTTTTEEEEEEEEKTEEEDKE